MTGARGDGEDVCRSDAERHGTVTVVSRGEPAVSVVIPVKDDAALLTRCLSALAAQDRPVDEIIVVDNGSSDDSADRARAAGARVVRCDDPGIPAAASAGYDAARGDLILRRDADCPSRGRAPAPPEGPPRLVFSKWAATVWQTRAGRLHAYLVG